VVEDVLYVVPAELLRPDGAAERSSEDRVQEWSHRQRILGGDQMDGRAHQRYPHDGPVVGTAGEFVGVERFEPVPQRCVGNRRDLRLEAHYVVHRLQYGHPDPVEQELAGERGSVERAPTENRTDVTRHDGIVARGTGARTNVHSRACNG